MAAEMRAQIEALMGFHPDADKTYRDVDVCRSYLAGLCPNSLFINTKVALGECGKIHSKKLRAEYEQARREGKVDYDRDLRKRLEILVEDCDRKIYRGLRRIEDENRCNKGLLPISKIIDSEGVRQLTEEIEKRKEALEEESLEDESDEVVSLEKRRAELQAEACMGTFMEEEKRRLGMNTRSEGATIGEEDKRRLEEKIKLAERLAEEGRTDEVQIVLAEFECMEAEFRAPPPKTRDDKKFDQNLRVCDVCGAYLSLQDNEARLLEHFAGKLHLGYYYVREKLRELQQKSRHQHRSSHYDSRDTRSTNYRNRSRRRSPSSRSRSRSRERSRRYSSRYH